MKLVHLASSLSRQGGGIFEIELALCQELRSLGDEVEVIGLADAHWIVDSPRWSPLLPKAFPVAGPPFWGYSRELKSALLNCDAQVAHLHTLWMYPSVALRNWAKSTKRPFVITPNGMLEPWALRNSSWKKKLALSLFESWNLRNAACLHVNTAKELADVRRICRPKACCILPNGVYLPARTNVETPFAVPREVGQKTLFYIGRLHPKKGLSEAIRAWAILIRRSNQHPPNWRFVIAGWDQSGHRDQLIKLCHQLHVSCYDSSVSEFLLQEATRTQAPSVHFLGPAFGDDKDRLLRHADAFILPSYSEGLPMAVLEAWAYGLPVAMTEACNLPEGFAAEAAWKLPLNQPADSLASSLHDFLTLSEQQLHEMGARGRVLVEQRFTWRRVAEQMQNVYRWILGETQRPDCVEL